MSCPGGWICYPWGENRLQSGELCLLLIVNINLVDILMYSHSCRRPLNLPRSISRLAIVCSKCHHSTMTVSISNLTWGNTHLPHPWDRLHAMGALSLIPFWVPFPYPLTYCAQWGLYQWLSARSLWGILPLHQIHSQLAHLSLWNSDRSQMSLIQPLPGSCYDHAQLRMLSGHSGRIAAL